MKDKELLESAGRTGMLTHGRTDLKGKQDIVVKTMLWSKYYFHQCAYMLLNE